MSRRRGREPEPPKNDGLGIFSSLLLAGGAAAVGFMAHKLMTDVETQEQSNQPSRGRGGVRGGERGGARGRARGGARGGAYDRARGGAYDGARRGAYDGARRGAYDGAHRGAYDGARRGAYDGAYRGARGGAYDGERGGGYRGARGGGASTTWGSDENRTGQRKTNRAKVADENLPDEVRCIVCMVNPREIILVPCNHVCLCEDCAEKIGTSCPVCNRNIQGKMVAYLP